MSTHIFKYIYKYFFFLGGGWGLRSAHLRLFTALHAILPKRGESHDQKPKSFTYVLRVHLHWWNFCWCFNLKLNSEVGFFSSNYVFSKNVFTGSCLASSDKTPKCEKNWWSLLAVWMHLFSLHLCHHHLIKYADKIGISWSAELQL